MEQTISIRRKISAILLIILALSITVVSIADRLQMMLYRFEVLIEKSGGSRLEQVIAGLNLIDSPVKLITGIGNAAQRALGVHHGIEVEPIYLLVNYGVLGLAVLMLILILIFIVGRKLSSLDEGEICIFGFAVLGSLIVYITFSCGYFFFQELIVGGIPWLLYGMALGIYSNLKRKKLAEGK